MAFLDLHQMGDTPVLLTDVKGVAALLRRSERSIWRDDIAGRLPRSITLGGSKRWRFAEIQEWVNAGCPDRSTWEARETETGESRTVLIQKNGGVR